MYVRTDGQNNPCILQDIVPLAPLPKKTITQYNPITSEMNENESLKRALALSLQASVGGSSSSTSVETYSGSSATSLTTAKSYMSAESSNPAPAIPVQNSLSVEDMRLKRLAFLEKSDNPLAPPPSQPSTSLPRAASKLTVPRAQTGTESDEDEALALALKMSKE